ncbi:MAG: universal stress protein [Burkholderiales bacterium]
MERPIVDLASSADQHAATATPAQPHVLLAADDTPASLAAVARFVERLAWYREPLAVDLVNVQAPVSRDVSAFVEEGSIKDLHHEEGMKAVQPVREVLERAGVPCVVHIGVGDFAHVIAHYAQQLNAREIFLTETARTDGVGLGEAVADVCEHAQVPVTILR